MEFEEGLKERARRTGEKETAGSRIIGTHLGKGIPTIAALLRERGYETGAFMANPMVSRRLFGLAEEFDIFDGSISCATGECGAKMNTLALSWIKRLEHEPWFCYIHYMDVHLPYDPPGSFKNQFYDQHENMPVASLQWLKKIKNRGPTAPELDYATAMYDASIAYVDQQICSLLNQLTGEEDPAEDLLVIVASDHGDEFYEHRNFGHAQSLYQELTKCPLVLVWPGRIPRSVRIGGLAENVDIVPTILSLIGVPVSQEIEGRSLLGNLENNRWHAPAFSEKQGMSIWDGRWKLWKDSSGRTLLFDLADDPEESRNLAREYPETLAVLSSQLEGWRESLVPPPFRSETLTNVRIDSSLAEMLIKLGYLE